SASQARTLLTASACWAEMSMGVVTSPTPRPPRGPRTSTAHTPPRSPVGRGAGGARSAQCGAGPGPRPRRAALPRSLGSRASRYSVDSLVVVRRLRVADELAVNAEGPLLAGHDVHGDAVESLGLAVPLGLNLFRRHAPPTGRHAVTRWQERLR